MSDTFCLDSSRPSIHLGCGTRYQGSYKELWSRLDPDGDNFLRVDEFAPVEGKLVLRFFNFMIAKYGSIRRAWTQVTESAYILSQQVQRTIWS